MNQTFEDKIFELISLKQEGEFWDFKRQWHENKADLLHDIICMANNLTDNDGYIIIGIDEENDYSIRDVASDLNRRNTQKIVDFLKDKKFAGDNRPTVYVQTIEWAEENIDVVVVVVQNNMNTPYYLAVDYRDKEKLLKANHIYTRIMDSNTAKDCNADLDKVEYLWKKRFGINKSALERVTIYLKDKKNWFQNEFEVVYYKYAPEFTIKCEYDESRKRYEVYMLGQIDNTPYWENINLYYHSTLLRTVSAVALDGGRCFSTAPNRKFIKIDKKNYCYYYFIENSLEYVLHEYYIFDTRILSEESWARQKFFDVVLLFNSEDEREKFNEYILTQQDRFVPAISNLPGYNVEELKQQWFDARTFKKLLDEFRNSNY